VEREEGEERSADEEVEPEREVGVRLALEGRGGGGNALREQVGADGPDHADDEVVIPERPREVALRVEGVAREEVEVGGPAEAAHGPEEQRGGELRA